MSLLDSLLDAIIRIDGDALVMRVGEKPYVVAPAETFGSPHVAGRPVELSSRLLTSATVAAVLNRMLSPVHRAALARSGMTEYDVTAEGHPTERFTIMAFRSDDDVSLEIRRRNRPVSAWAAAADLDTYRNQADRSTRADAVDGDDVMTEGELSEMLRASPARAGGRVDHPGGRPPGRAAAPAGQTESAAGGRVAPSRAAAQVVALSRRLQPDAAVDGSADAAAIWRRAVQAAAAKGAASLYLVPHAPATVRVGGEFLPLESVPGIDAPALERLIADLRSPESGAFANAEAEWISYVPGCGPVRCIAFEDRLGPGLHCRMLSAPVLAADEVELTPEIHTLASEADGLVLVAGGRGSGRTRFLASLVDRVNRTRSDHVITVEARLAFVHDRQRAFVSQREIRGDGAALAAAVRSAIREEPDVLVIDELQTPEIAALAIDAAESGMLVFAALEAEATAGAVERMLEMARQDRGDRAQAQLAGVLRGIVALLLLRKRTGGRLSAREVLLHAPKVAQMIVEGRTEELAAAFERERPPGLVPFAETLASLVRNGTVHPSHAWRRAPSREPFLAALRRNGVATEVLERFA